MTEQQAYDVVEAVGGYELRRYPRHLVAETGIDASFESAGTRAFRALVGYLGGGNATGDRLAMTAPVLQEPAGSGPAYTVAFVLPASTTQAGAPQPTDPRVRVREVGEEWALVARYSGRWSRGSYERHEEALRAAADRRGLTVAGPARWARFDPPWTPWFLRRNEVILPVRVPADVAPGGSLES